MVYQDIKGVLVKKNVIRYLNKSVYLIKINLLCPVNFLGIEPLKTMINLPPRKHLKPKGS
jgi:hypothetical protein